MAAEIAAIVAVPVAVILAIAVQSNDDASDSKGTRPNGSTVRPSPKPKPSPTPTETLESAWARDQGRLCHEMNRRAAANRASRSADVTEQLPTTRATSRIVARFVADSAGVGAPESYRDRLEIMLGHWSDASAFLIGMIRSAERGDAMGFNQRLKQFDEKMEAGMRIARDLGARLCT